MTKTIQFGVTTFGDVPHRPGEERLSDAASIREIAQQMGLLILVTLMLFVFYNDIHRLLEG